MPISRLLSLLSDLLTFKQYPFLASPFHSTHFLAIGNYYFLWRNFNPLFCTTLLQFIDISQNSFMRRIWVSSDSDTPGFLL